jgi:predicted transcriptional regulator
MSTVTLSIPDEKHERLESLAKARQMSVDQLMDDLATRALAEFDARSRFMALAAGGDVERGLALLEKLDQMEKERRKAEIKGRGA